MEKSRRRRRRVIHFGLLLLIVALAHHWRTQSLASGMAPPLMGHLRSGENFELALQRGEPVLVHFWATWCPVCRLGERDIEALAEEHSVVTVAMQSGGARDIATHMDEEGLNFPVITDRDGELAARWGVRGVPASFVVDGAGRIRFSTVGYSTPVGLRGRLWLADKLAQ